MANLGKWNTASVTTILSTELNTLGSGTQSAASSAVANDTSLDMYVDIEVLLASFTPGTAPYVALYILQAVDGTNYPAQSAADLRLTTTQLLAAIPVGSTAATAQRVVARNIVIPPGKFKIVFDNQTGANLAASGNTVKFSTYDVNLNG